MGTENAWLGRLMDVEVRAGLLTTLLLVSACTASRDGSSSPSSETRSPTSGGSPTTAPNEPGWLAINLHFDPDAFFLTEGSVSFVEVFDVSGELAERNRSRDWRPFFRMQLAPGRYEVKIYRRPCDGSCQALDPPQDTCEFDVEMPRDGGNRLVVVRVRASGECRVSDKGDVIDLEMEGTVTNLVSLKDALLDAGYQVRERLGHRWLKRFFLVRPRTLVIGAQDLQVFEYPSRSQLMEISISPDGTSISSSEGISAIIEWQPHIYRSGRLLVLYLGDNAIVLETLSLVLGRQVAGR